MLTERAHTLLRNLGYADSAADEAVGYATDIDYLQYIDEHDQSPARWRALATSQPPALLFWYRQSPRRLVPIGGANLVTQLNPPPTRSGMVSLTLDRTGRLVSLLAVPVQVAESPESPAASVSRPAADWNPLFEEAGLSIARFSPAQPQVDPADFRGCARSMGGRVSRTPRCAHSDRGGSCCGEAGVLRDRRAVDPAQKSKTCCRATRQESASVSTCAQPWHRWPLPSPCCWRCAICVSGRGDRRGAMRLSMFLLAAGAMSQRARNRRPAGAQPRACTRAVRPGVRVGVVYRARATHPSGLARNHDWMEPIAGGQPSRSARRTRCAGRRAGGDRQRVDPRRAHRLRRWSGLPPQFPVGASSSPFDGMAASSDLLLGGRYALSRIIGSMMSIPVWSGTMLTFLLLFVLSCSSDGARSRWRR